MGKETSSKKHPPLKFGHRRVTGLTVCLALLPSSLAAAPEGVQQKGTKRARYQPTSQTQRFGDWQFNIQVPDWEKERQKAENKAAEKKEEKTNQEHREPTWDPGKNGLKNPDWKTESERVKQDPVFGLFNQFSDEYTSQILERAHGLMREATEYWDLSQKKKQLIVQKYSQVPKNEQYDWQREERRDRAEKALLRHKRKTSQGMVARLTRVMKLLTEIRAKQMRNSQQFIQIQEIVYREYVKNQYFLKNYTQCIPILNKYRQLRPRNNREYKVHEYLASCYHYQEKLAKRGRPGNDRFQYFQSKKHQHLLELAKLKYGTESPEYRKIEEQVERERILSVN